MRAGWVRSQEADTITVAEITSVGVRDQSGHQSRLAGGRRGPGPKIGTFDLPSVHEPERATANKGADSV